jgi:peroxiredoxin
MISHFVILALILAWAFIIAGVWLGWQLLRQNGRLLLRLDELEKRLDELEFGEDSGLTSDSAGMAEPESDRASRFGSRSLARSRIARDGLKAGTTAPDFRLPRTDGRGELSLGELRGKPVMLVFSSPHCGPCNTLAPELQKLYRKSGQNGNGETKPLLELVMISKGEPGENRAQIKEHHLTFPVLLQQQWEVSRRYAMFATPIAYLIDEHGIIAKDVAVGVEPILDLLVEASAPKPT